MVVISDHLSNFCLFITQNKLLMIRVLSFTHKIDERYKKLNSVLLSVFDNSNYLPEMI